MTITDIIITTTNGNNVKYNKSDMADLENAYKNFIEMLEDPHYDYLRIVTDDGEIETILAIKHIVGMDVIRS